MINVLLLVKRYSGDYPLLNEMARLDEMKFRVVVCYLSGADDGKNGVSAIAAKSIYLGLASRKLRPSNPALLRRLAAIIDEECIDVVNCHLHRTIGPGVLAARFAARRPAVIATLHGLDSAAGWRRKIGNWLLYQGLFRVVGVSRAVCRDILESNWALPEEKVVAVANGLNLAPFLESPVARKEAREKILPGKADGRWFGTVGRLSAVKNQHRLIQAFARLLEEHPESRLVLAGKGELENDLRGLADTLGIADRVHFLGYRTDVATVLRSLDVFVLPSLREGFGLSLLEAMAAGLPVVAARVGGIPEILADAEAGRLVEPADVEGLAAVLEQMASFSDQALVAMGERARRRAVGNFSAQTMVRRYEMLYEAAGGRRQPKKRGEPPPVER